MPIIVKNAWQQKSWWATMGLMGKRTKNLFLDMKKWVRKEVRSSSGTSIIDPLPLRALHKSLAQLPKIGILTILRQDWQFLATLLLFTHYLPPHQLNCVVTYRANEWFLTCYHHQAIQPSYCTILWMCNCLCQFAISNIKIPCNCICVQYSRSYKKIS